MNRRTLWMALVVTSALFYVGCGCSNGLKVEITQAPATVVVNATSSVTAIVTHDHAAGGVNWSCTPVGSCGSFNPTQTASGVASVYTAPAAAGTVTIIATSVDKPSRSASVSVTITASTVPSSNYSFYVTGEENNGDGDNYVIAGVVAIATDGSGTVVGGEQDYNDGDGITVPQDSITGGSLALNDDGTGTLSISTASGTPGLDGTETFSVVFPNPNHALITQFDGTATSSGSLDLQTSTAQPVSASFAFVAAGTDSDFLPIAYGGVISVDGSGNLTGTVDVNDGGSVSTGNAIPEGASLGVPDSFGRGTVNGTTGFTTNVFYVVGPEVVRFVDVDANDTAVGSAYGQGSGTFSSGSIGQSVFSIWSAYAGYAGVGEFFTFAEDTAKPRSSKAKSNGVHPEGGAACTGTDPCGFEGVADLNDGFNGVLTTADDISGEYVVGTNGYGSLEFDESTFGDDVEILGVYAVDPTLNILDPNDTTDGLGGALIAEMDEDQIGIGSIVPQTDTTTGSFAGTYAFGATGDTDEGDEFDFLGSASVTALAFTGNGTLSDPFGSLTDIPGDYSSVAFAGLAVPDEANIGRYTFTSSGALALSNDAFDGSIDLDVTAYQAYGGQLFWVEVDEESFFGGSLEQFPGTGSDAKKRAKNKKH
jgi:hypothetical protein